MSDLFAEVAVNSTMPHRQTFSYALPDHLRHARRGHVAYVPFGRRLLQGVILEVHDTPVFSEPEKIRPVVSLDSDNPLIDDAHVALARWLAAEYLAPVYECVALMLPPGFGQKPVTHVRAMIDPDEVAALQLPDRQTTVLRIVATHGRMTLDGLRRQAPVRSIEPVVLQLERRDLLRREYGLARPGARPRIERVVSLAVPPDAARERVLAHEPPRRSRRAALIERLLERRAVSDDEAARIAGGRPAVERLIRDGVVRRDREGHSVELAMSPLEAHAWIRALTRTVHTARALSAIDALSEGPRAMPALRGIATPSVLARLRELGLVRVEERVVERDPLAHTHVEPLPPPVLLPSQLESASAICASLDAHRPATFLLHGVTGSGKTEVYLHALRHCVDRGRRAIVLVPEIALTPQTVRRFRERFERVAVLHSGLSDGERFDQWHGVRAGRYDVVIGPRGATFAPQPDLGLIIIDEEHEWTYKQHETAPRYHARAAALELARLTSATLVLGSATPDVESYERAARGVYRLLTLPDRVRPVIDGRGARRLQAASPLPRVSVVDMRDELHAGNRSIFSRLLRSEVEQALASGEQVILFLNRRGMAGHVQCRDCGFVPECPSCFVALTYHRQYDRLVCHQCNRRLRMPASCGQCGSPRVRLVGAGVEQLQVEAARTFPSARILRWDRDTTGGRQAHERIVEQFERHEADILIGTQMLAKGIDMPGVTVVGAVNADIGLHIPDFRAGERTFQVLSQVAGRAGRGERPGHAIIQTYHPDSYAIDAAARHDYEGFAARELEARRAAGYPPFGRLARLVFAHSNPRFARDEAMRMQRALALRRAQLGADAEIIGPSPAYVPRVRGRWRWHVLIKGSDPAAILRDFLLPKGWSIDIDPYSA